MLPPPPSTLSPPPDLTAWFLIAGTLLVLMALSGSVLKRLPLSAAVLYLLVGVALGPPGLNLLRLDARRDAVLLETLAEIAVLVSLFTTGLKLGTPLHDWRWSIPVRLATLSMVLTVGMVTLVGMYLLHLSPGVAVLLGALLSPTDPVLASDVQVEHHEDRDRLRFGLSGEAGLNDGTAFPFVMLGLGLLGLHDLGPGGGRWLLVDIVWAVSIGLGCGFLLGTAVARLVLYLRQVHKEALGLDEFLTLGLIALSYGLAELLHANGFLAVFAAGLALRRTERRATARAEEKTAGEEEAAANTEEQEEQAEAEAIATDPRQAPAHLAGSVLSFNEQLERIGEVTLVLLAGGLLGGMAKAHQLPLTTALWFVPLLFLLIRPVAVVLGLLGSRVKRDQRILIGWFGIRGIGSVYYLTYAFTHGLPEDQAQILGGLTFVSITASILFHGISVTPLMNRYQAKRLN